MPPGKVGRRPADRRVSVSPPGSPYFRLANDGVIVVGRLPSNRAVRSASSWCGFAASRSADHYRTRRNRPNDSRRSRPSRSSRATTCRPSPTRPRRSCSRCSRPGPPRSGSRSRSRRSSSSSWRSSSSHTVRRSGHIPTAAAVTSSRGRTSAPAAGLVAAAALLTDYVLTVSVSVAAGVAAITSAFPGALDDVRVELAAVSIAVVMLINLRGVRESGTIFAIPTYVFVGSMLVLIGVGFARTMIGAAPVVTDVVPAAVPAQTFGVLLLMRAFADGAPRSPASRRSRTASQHSNARNPGMPG